MKTSSGDAANVWEKGKREIERPSSASSLLPLGDVSHWWSATYERRGGERLSHSFPLRTGTSLERTTPAVKMTGSFQLRRRGETSAVFKSISTAQLAKANKEKGFVTVQAQLYGEFSGQSG